MILSPTSWKGRIVIVLGGFLVIFLTFHTYSDSGLVISQPPSLNHDKQRSSPRAAAVKEAFGHAFKGYWARCKGEDEIMPVTNRCQNTRYDLDSRGFFT